MKPKCKRHGRRLQFRLVTPTLDKYDRLRLISKMERAELYWRYKALQVENKALKKRIAQGIPFGNGTINVQLHGKSKIAWPGSPITMWKGTNKYRVLSKDDKSKVVGLYMGEDKFRTSQLPSKLT